MGRVTAAFGAAAAVAMAVATLLLGPRPAVAAAVAHAGALPGTVALLLRHGRPPAGPPPLTNPDELGAHDGGGGVGGTLNRTDAAAARPAAVVTLHGLGGSDPKAVAALRADVDAATLGYTSVYGPSAGTDGGGNPRSWFPIGSATVGRVPTADAGAGAAADLAATADRVDAVIAAAVRRGVPRARIVLVGYSLGAAAAADYTLSGRADGLGAVVVSGGWTPRPGRVVPAGAAAGVRVVVRHGRLDVLVPFRAATRLRDALAAAGAAVTLEAYPWAGHFLNEYGAAEADLAPLLATLLPA
ncbi:hypothetical protein BU14_0323s0007 [Porphyra umbilicalis]|uniref:Phospholipase/carboxylesterase/thioesterase domain-containing protein n=1 Tax=Porphyra umbilicalis TaxID=2786 RepID=A0A1X6NZN7_PORUM|nr:hypothetical protein BU14_0323s0007 [Porphyra umbilicalis]|eukprot:OSX73863.1 hypothetical protein BU14_0323s0007 [Porphyra umbilicalis]